MKKMNIVVNPGDGAVHQELPREEHPASVLHRPELLVPSEAGKHVWTLYITSVATEEEMTSGQVEYGNIDRIADIKRGCELCDVPYLPGMENVPCLGHSLPDDPATLKPEELEFLRQVTQVMFRFMPEATADLKELLKIANEAVNAMDEENNE